MLFIYLFLQTLKFIRFICKSFVFRSHKTLAFFSLHFFFFQCNFNNNITLALCFSLFWHGFLFFSLESRNRSRGMWWTRSYHFTSFSNLLSCWHFTNEMYIFLLIFVVTKSNIKSQLASHAEIVHPTQIFWKEQSGSVFANKTISFKVFLELWKMLFVFDNKIINNFRCILVFQQQFV